jgi:hypothetical protein
VTFATAATRAAGLAGKGAPFCVEPLRRAADDAGMEQPTIIANRGEFVDALRALKRGHVLVHASESWGGCSIDGGPVGASFRTLADYALIDEYDNPHGFEHIRYYRLSDRGREFAERAVQAWERRPLIERLAARLLG